MLPKRAAGPRSATPERYPTEPKAKWMGLELVSDSTREHYILELRDWSEWPERLEVAKPAFILFIVGDSTSISPSELSAFAALAVAQGVLYICAWGHGCEDVETAFDLVQVQAEVEHGQENPLIMTTSHAGESFADAAWFSLNTAFPHPDWDGTSFCWVGVVVDAPDRATDLRGWLSRPQSLDEIVGVVG